MALVTCPDCKREISEAATACPGCGRPLVAAAATAGKKEALGCLAFVLLSVFILWVAGSFTDAPEPAPPAGAVRATRDSAIEVKLAALELGTPGMEQTVPEALVMDFTRMLTSLSERCSQNRIQIADMGVTAVEQLRGEGRKMGYLEWFRGIDSLLIAYKAEANGSTDCRVVFATALTALAK